jgi:hypothetical protein
LTFFLAFKPKIWYIANVPRDPLSCGVDGERPARRQGLAHRAEAVGDGALLVAVDFHDFSFDKKKLFFPAPYIIFKN